MAYLLRLVARFLLTVGFRRLRLQSPPSSPSSAPVDLALAAWSTSASLAGASALAPGCLWCPPHHRVSWMAICNPDIAAMLCSAARPWARCRPLAIAASGWWPCCHNYGCVVIVSPPWPSSMLLGAPSCEFLLFFLFMCACYGGLASEPGMLAYAVAVPCCYCCLAQACAAAVLLELHC
jgi:hypothetical protein